MDAQLNIGSVLLDKYRVERLLGQGGMGVVVAVRHIDLGQLHAMKFLLPDALGHQEAVERFLREARAAAILRSHHVVRVHDVGRMSTGAPYMLMEHLEGCDLKKYLELQGRLPVDEAIRFVLQACDAIAEAHDKGIIHRDLKPANLFLARQRGGLPLVKVLDFGISKQTGPDNVDLTDTNATLGSPLYMSPEQLAKSKTVDVRTDIWALGLIGYELLTGECPFRASTMLEVALKIVQDEPRPLREVRPDVPLGIASALMRCLCKKREDRWSSVEEFASALEKFASQTSTAHLAQPAMTNEVVIEPKVVLQAPVVPALPNPVPIASVPSQTAPMLTAAERTSLTFGTTGKTNLVNRVRTTRIAVGTTLAFMALGAVYVLSQKSATQNIVELGSANEARVTSVLHPIAPPPSASTSETAPNPPVESTQKEEPVKPVDLAIPKTTPVPAPIVKTTATVQSVKSQPKQGKPAELAPTIQPIRRRNPVAL